MKSRLRYKEHQERFRIHCLLKVSIIVILIIVTIMAYRTIKADINVR